MISLSRLQTQRSRVDRVERREDGGEVDDWWRDGSTEGETAEGASKGEKTRSNMTILWVSILDKLSELAIANIRQFCEGPATRKLLLKNVYLEWFFNVISEKEWALFRALDAAENLRDILLEYLYCFLPGGQGTLRPTGEVVRAALRPAPAAVLEHTQDEQQGT